MREADKVLGHLKGDTRIGRMSANEKKLWANGGILSSLNVF